MIHPTVFPKIEQLTDNVLNWYQFTEKWHYTIRPYAALVAIELHNRKHSPNTLTREQIEDADDATGSRMRQMWEAVNNATYREERTSA